MRSLFAMLGTLALATPALAQDVPDIPLDDLGPLALADSQVPSVEDTVEKLDRALELTDAQRADVLPILRAYATRRHEIESDASLTPASRNERLREAREGLAQALRPYLTDAQRGRLAEAVEKVGSRRRRRLPLRPQIGVTYSRFTPSGDEAKAIFGRNAAAWGVSFVDPGRRWTNAREGFRLGFSVDTLSVQNGDDNLFVFSPQLSLRYVKPLGQSFLAYGELSAGPAYMDYTYDYAGRHYGAKRLGAVGLAEVGLRYGPFQLGIDYHLMTEPSGISFNGSQFSFRWSVIRF